jgi:hypothetical protein
MQLMANRKYAHNVTSGCAVEYSLHTGRISVHIKPGRRNSCGLHQTAGLCCPAFVSHLQAINFFLFLSESYLSILLSYKGPDY